jgi:cysteine desulfuration protein SufE
MAQELKNLGEETAHLLEKKREKLKKKFLSLSVEERYHALISLGRELPSLSKEHKIQENIVRGCQSALYLRSYTREGKIFFEASSDALISAGLAALLISIYNGETPETVLKNPPHFLHELGLYASLSPGRSNGLAHIYLRMQQEALRWLKGLDQ